MLWACKYIVLWAIVIPGLCINVCECTVQLNYGVSKSIVVSECLCI